MSPNVDEHVHVLVSDSISHFRDIANTNTYTCSGPFFTYGIIHVCLCPDYKGAA
jgi:hypothetical protein